MRKAGVLFLCGLLWVGAAVSPALPQPRPATETVTVTGQKIAPVPRAVIDKMITTRIAPTRLAGKIARWKDPICPETFGVKPEWAAAVTQRIRDVAVTAGARVETKSPCTANVTIVFTTTPQALLDDIAAHRPGLLGYHESVTEIKAQAMMRHPIQAWYATETRDFMGQTHPDNKDYCDRQHPKYAPDPDMTACTYITSGMTLDDGISSDFSTVLVVADWNTLGSHPFSAIADYIAMFVLSQTKSFDSCDALPTIANLMSQSCDAQWKTDALTEGDIAYLHALYKMQPGGNLHSQQNDIARGMARDLEGR